MVICPMKPHYYKVSKYRLFERIYWNETVEFFGRGSVRFVDISNELFDLPVRLGNRLI